MITRPAPPWSNPRREGTLTIFRQFWLLSRPILTKDPPSRFNGQRDTAVTSAGNPAIEDL
jgi:hypothetical protein